MFRGGEGFRNEVCDGLAMAGVADSIRSNACRIGNVMYMLSLKTIPTNRYNNVLSLGVCGYTFIPFSETNIKFALTWLYGLDWLIDRSIACLLDWLIDRSIDRLIDRSIDRLIEWVGGWVSERASEGASDWLTEWDGWSVKSCTDHRFW